MTPQETLCFWTWYKSGLGQTGKRSFRRTAEQLHDLGIKKAVQTLIDMAESSEPTWYELAAEKDAEIARKLDDAVIGSILETAKEVQSRQRLLIRELYKKAMQAISGDSIEFKLPDIIKLMEFEAQLSGAIKSEAGEALAGVLQFVSSTTRSELHRAIRESRLHSADDPIGPGVEHPSSN